MIRVSGGTENLSRMSINIRFQVLFITHIKKKIFIRFQKD